MIILLTLERYVAVCWPLRSKRILSMTKAVWGTLSVLVFAIFLNIPIWFDAQENFVETEIACFSADFCNHPIGWKISRGTASMDLLLYTDYREFYHGWLWVTLMYGIPIPLLVLLNFRIYKQVSYEINNY